MKQIVLCLLAACVLTAVSFAADKPATKDKAYETSAAADAPPALEFANTWAANGPYNLENLKGKCVVLYFYVDT